MAAASYHPRILIPKYEQTDNVKPLTTNRGLQFAVGWPNLDLKVSINLNILPESSRNELKYSLKIALMFLSIILKFQVPDMNILLGIRKKAIVFDQGG